VEELPRLTQAQYELWIDQPVTKQYLQCLEWSGERIAEALGRGGFVNSRNNDETCNSIHSALGEVEGLLKASEPFEIFIEHEMITLPEEEPQDVESD
jgi:hypothetical protein